MSVFEVLIAAALLLVISLGILALLTRALANNTHGWEATAASNLVRTQLDTNLGEPLSSPALDIGAGTAETVNTTWWAQGSNSLLNDDDEGWYATEPTDKGIVIMTKEQQIRQYNVKTLAGTPTGFNSEGEWEFVLTQAQIDTPLSGDADDTFIHIKRIEVTLTGERQGGPLGSGQTLLTETFKSF